MDKQLPYKFKSKKGNDVVFRYPTMEDLDAVLDFANRLIDEDTFIELSGRHKSRDEQKKWLSDILEQIKKGEKVHIAVSVNGVYAGNGEVRIGKLRKQHVGELGIVLAKEFRDEGIGTVLLKTLLDEARTMGLTLVTLNCFENNTRACHVYEKLGFQRAGVIPNAIKWKDGYVGEVKFYLPL